MALATRRENAAPRRLAAILLGFISTAILVITREGMLSGQVSWWLIAAFSLPFLYSAYNWFAALWWPPRAHPLSAGVAESIWSGLLAVPFLIFFAPPWSPQQLPPAAYLTVLLACGMWIVERIAFFTLIREKGAVFTVQAVYLSTPAAVLVAILAFGGCRHLALRLARRADGGALSQQYRLSRQTDERLISASSRSRVTGTVYSAHLSAVARGSCGQDRR